MQHLFSQSGKRVLDSLAFTKTLYAFDYDGTLAPIVTDPEKAGVPKNTNVLMKSLSKLVPVAIVSGRSKADLSKKIDFEPSYLIGNHGLEGLSFNKESAFRAKQKCDLWKRRLERGWRFDPGVFIEDKNYSLAIHYRKSRRKKTIRTELFEKIGKLSPAPRVVLGKCVMNLVPPGAPHKGVAVLELMVKNRSMCAFYVGDDDTDEDVFSLPDSNIITVRIGQKRNSLAQFYLKRQSEMNLLLKRILKNCRTAGIK